MAERRNARSRGLGRRQDDVWGRWDKRVRDSIIFMVGVGGCINELWLVPEPRPAALVFLASLIGVPFVLSADEGKSVSSASERKDAPHEGPDDER